MPIAQTARQAETFLTVEGMMCGSCAAAVEAVLQKQPGVLRAGVNFAADAAMVRWNPAVTSLSRLQTAVRRLGYTVYPADSPDDRQNRIGSFRRALQMRLAVAAMFGMWSMLAAIVLYLAPTGMVEVSAYRPLAIASGILALPVLLYSASHFYLAGWRTLRAGTPGMDTLIGMAVIAAVVISVFRLLQGSWHVYFDAAVMLVSFQLVARLIDHNIRRTANQAMQSYLHNAPSEVVRMAPDGTEETLAATAVKDGELIRVSHGQRIPLDGRVLQGGALIDMSLLNGESVPRYVDKDDELLAGSVVIDGELVLTVTGVAGKRRIDALARSVRGLLSQKTAMQRLTDRIAYWLLPVVLLSSVLAVGLALLQDEGMMSALARGLAVLIVTCPCALSLAIPLVAVLATRGSARQGIIFRDPGMLEEAARATTVIFDKTGTLTTPVPKVTEIVPAPDVERDALLGWAAAATAGTHHPVARGLAAAAGDVGSVPGKPRLVPGQGVRRQSGGRHILAGRRAWLEQEGIAVPDPAFRGMQVHVAVDGRYAGHIRFCESLRPGARDVVAALRAAGYSIGLLSGDSAAAVEAVAATLGIPASHVWYECSPEDKQSVLQNLEQGEGAAFVGDGMNDGPALACVRLGIAVGRADATARAAAAVLLPGGLDGLPRTLELARRSRLTMRQNLVWALAYNGVALPAAVLGWIHPVIAALAMTGSTLCILLNTALFRSRLGRRPAPEVPPRTRVSSSATA